MTLIPYILCLCDWLCLFLWVRVCLCFCLSLSLCVSVWVSLCVAVWVSVHIYVVLCAWTFLILFLFLKLSEIYLFTSKNYDDSFRRLWNLTNGSYKNYRTIFYRKNLIPQTSSNMDDTYFQIRFISTLRHWPNLRLC